MKLPTILDYEVIVPKPGGTVWFMFHGWTDRNDFKDICRIHEHVPTCYIKAPRWWCGGGGWLPHGGSWDERLAGPVTDTILHVLEQDLPGTESIILAGNSDGATFVHHYASSFLYLTMQVKAIVHYAGRWKGVKATVPAFFFLGEDEHIKKIKKETQQAAKEYGEQVRVLSGGHRWNPDENQHIIKLVDPNEIQNSRTV